MIGLSAYLMGRDKEFPPTPEMLEGANDLLERVDALFYDLRSELNDFDDDDDVSSGYRPGRYNTMAGGSLNSSHLKCVAIDLKETEKREISSEITEKLLKKHGLYMEHPSHTSKKNSKGVMVYWCHLQTRATRNRIFIP